VFYLSNRNDYLILGSSGMLGHVVFNYLTEKKFSVIGISRRVASATNISMDLSDFESLKNLILELRPKFIVNCAGVLNEDVDANPNFAIKINSLLPKFLESITKSTDTKILHISTDCVFSGLKGSYKITDWPDALDLYGKTKFLGEVVNSKDLTIRTSIIGPDINPKGKGLYHWFMNQKQSINGFINVKWSGVTTLQLAKFIEYLYDKEISGLMHYCNNESISKYDLLQLLNLNSNNMLEIKADGQVISDKSLVSELRLIDHVVPSYKEMVIEIFTWIKSHEDQYSYNLGVMK
jgi:dTDP-4-dehydrorhamnose reductase